MSFTAYMKSSSFSHLLLTITFILSGIIINLVQACLYYFLRPTSKYLFRKINYYLCYSLYSQLVFMAEYWSGSDVILYIDKEDFEKYYGKEHALLILNHSYDIDWLIGWIFCDRVRVLGNCRAYAKKSVQYVPTMGWTMKFSESVFLERSWDKDKLSIGRQVAELADYPDPMFLLIFAEGTRYTEEKHKASVEFAKERGLPVLKHHLTPRTKGFTTSLPYLKEKVPAIYNVQMIFDPKDKIKPTVMNLLLGKPVVGHLMLERIPVSDVPENEEDAAKWLMDLYEKKDRLAESFLQTGDMFKTSGVTRIESFRLPRRPYSLINLIFWASVILLPSSYYLFYLLTSGSTTLVSIGLIIVFIFFCGMNKLIELTRTDRGSSYGRQTPTTPVKQNGVSEKAQ